METHVINRIREDIYCRWLYFLMESCVINHVRRYLLLLAIFSMESNKSYSTSVVVGNKSCIRRHLLLLAIFSMESCVINIFPVGYIFQWKVM